MMQISEKTKANLSIIKDKIQGYVDLPCALESNGTFIVDGWFSPDELIFIGKTIIQARWEVDKANENP